LEFTKGVFLSSFHTAELAHKNLLRMPAEWEPHEATWIAWPSNESDWQGKFEPIKWVYAEIAKNLAISEKVEILCKNEAVKKEARECIEAHHGDLKKIRFHILDTDRGWLRDSMPTGIFLHEKPAWVRWQFNAWAKYDNYLLDEKIPHFVSSKTGIKIQESRRPNTDELLVCEGGAIDTDGEGTLLVTEECLLSDIQERNPGFKKKDYEKAFAQNLGIEKIIWLKAGVHGDDTHGHIDDVARFVGPRTVLLAYEDNVADDNHSLSLENLQRLNLASDAKGRSLNVVLLPMPKPVYFKGERLPASYANFYIGNEVVLVPTFNDPKDRLALNIIAQAFPGRGIVGINSVDLVLGLGTIHCLTQQQPK